MAHQFFFICPVCFAEDSIVKLSCRVCKTKFRTRDANISFNDQQWPFSEYLNWARKHLTIVQNEEILESRSKNLNQIIKDKPIRISSNVVLRQGQRRFIYKGSLNLFQRKLRIPLAIANGIIILSENAFYFKSPQRTYQFNFKDISCITTNGHYFEFKIKKEPFYQINFKNESPLKYEILFQKIISRYYSRAGKTPLEFQPNLIFIPKGNNNSLHPNSFERQKNVGFFSTIFRNMLLLIIRLFFRIFIQVNIVGKENIPKDYPFICILNHQSSLDPFIVLSFLCSRIGFLTKSTSFSHLFERSFLKLGLAIPTTRYQTDPAVVRHIEIFLRTGIPVGIFPEGERCWDGKMQDFKYSVVRLLVYLRYPVIPIVIQNAYSFMPRWAKFPGRQKIYLTVKPPFSLIPERFSLDDHKNYLELLFWRKLDQ